MWDGTGHPLAATAAHPTHDVESWHIESWCHGCSHARTGTTDKNKHFASHTCVPLFTVAASVNNSDRRWDKIHR